MSDSSDNLISDTLENTDYKFLLDSVFQVLPDIFFLMSIDGTIKDYHCKTSSELYVPPESFMGKKMQDILPAATAEQFIDNICLVNKTKQLVSFDYSLEISTVVKQFEARLTPHPNNNDIIAIVRDITERKYTENSLAEKSNELALLNKQLQASNDNLSKLSRAVNACSSSVIITDSKGRIEYVNPKFTAITGYQQAEVLAKKTRFLQSSATPSSTYSELWRTISAGKDWKGEFHNKKKDGSLYRARNSISSVKNTEGIITNYICIQDDVSHEYELSEKLSFQASHDSLTGLINRQEFERRTDRLLANLKHDEEGEHALCFMDLDQFKIINDTCGHSAGDEMLRQIGVLLQKTVRQRDTLARLGGDEFGVLMEHCSLDDAHRVSMAILKAIQDYQFSWQDYSFKLGVSIGLVAITKNSPNLSELLKHADAACYVAKDNGRNRVHVHDLGDAEIAQRHGEMQWVTRINKAIIENRFCLYAQAIVPLNSSQEMHYEFLIRMIDERGEIIPPGAFLPPAERYNLISKLDSWVVTTAFELLEKNPRFIDQVNFCSINLSGQSLTDMNFQELIVEKFKHTTIPAKKICFEITETAAITNLSSATLFISKMKELGCRFALDDFGSGLSSFGYLKNLPVDFLKIDGMFVKNIAQDPIDRAMVKSINEIGQVMGMHTIAEFVENAEIKNILNDIGVDHAQGYGISKPLPVDDVLKHSFSL